MAAGTIQNVVTCIANGTVGNSVLPCATVGTTRYIPKVVTGYLIDSTASNAIDSVTGPVDYASLGGLWGFSFTSTLILWMLAKKAGIVVQAVRGM